MIDQEFDSLSSMHAKHRAEVAALMVERDRYRRALAIACDCVPTEYSADAEKAALIDWARHELADERKLVKDHQALVDNLTATQERCNELLAEARVLRRALAR